MRLLIAFVMIACPLPALAIYKCETGRTVSYSDMPCQSGKSTTIVTDSAGDAAASSAAESRLEEQKAELQRLQEARHRREAQDEKAAQKLYRARAAKQKRCAKLALEQKWRNEDAAMAVGKAAERTRIKARRMGEAVQLECGQAFFWDHLRQNRRQLG